MMASPWRAALLSGGLLVILPLQAALAQRGAAPATQAQQQQQRPAVDPQAVQALRNMSAYLRTLQNFEIRVATSRDELDANDQKLQFVGSIEYKVRRPNGLVIRSDEGGRVRELFYDGKTLTLFTPSTGFFAKAPAPPTIRQTLALAADRYDIHPPLVDLFKWGMGEDNARLLTSGYKVGEETVQGQPADHYAFRQNGVDWQIWIARGDRPLPLRIAVTSTTAPERPTFDANLAWNTRQQFADNTFVFRPPPESRQIGLASLQ